MAKGGEQAATEETLKTYAIKKKKNVFLIY
jgi:hypothetical protein